MLMAIHARTAGNVLQPIKDLSVIVARPISKVSSAKKVSNSNFSLCKWNEAFSARKGGNRPKIAANNSWRPPLYCSKA